MLDNNLKQELLKAYNNVSKASKVEYNQQNLDDLVKLFHDNEYLTVVGDSLRERIAKALAFLECTQEVIDTRGAGVERLGYRHATHT